MENENREVSMRQAMMEVAKMAKEDGRAYFLFHTNKGWMISAHWWHDWLFKAYPGGRKEMTVLGKKMFDAVKDESWDIQVIGPMPVRADLENSINSLSKDEQRDLYLINKWPKGD